VGLFYTPGPTRGRKKEKKGGKNILKIEGKEDRWEKGSREG